VHIINKLVENENKAQRNISCSVVLASLHQTCPNTPLAWLVVLTAATRTDQPIQTITHVHVVQKNEAWQFTCVNNSTEKG